MTKEEFDTFLKELFVNYSKDSKNEYKLFTNDQKWLEAIDKSIKKMVKELDIKIDDQKKKKTNR